MALSEGDARSGVTVARSLSVPRIWLALACVFFSAPLAANGTAEPSPTDLIEGLLSGRAPVGGPFELTDQTGHRRTDADFQGKLVVLYFGYTYCPDVCPTELQSISLALDKLGAAATTVQPLFITVDPERDTKDALAKYVTAFDPRFLGMYGDLEATRRVAKDFKIYFEKRKTGSSYSIDHSAQSYVIDPQGRLRLLVRHDRISSDLPDDLKALLRGA